MDIRVLKQFLSLADHLHFGRAAKACHASPSTLSRAIKQLEDELGVTLFERDNRSVVLTVAGARFQRYAREAVDQWQEVCRDLQAGAGELRGELSLYCSVTASYSFLHDILSRLRTEHPRIEIKLHTGDPELALPRVQAGEADVAIAARPDRLPPELVFKRIADSPLVFVAPAEQTGGKMEFQKSLREDRWERIPMIVSEQGLARRRVDAWFRERGLRPRIYAQVAGNEAIVSMVSLGFGIGVVPKIVLDNSPLADRVTVVAAEPALKGFEVGLLAQQKMLRSPLLAALWSQLPG